MWSHFIPIRDRAHTLVWALISTTQDCYTKIQPFRSNWRVGPDSPVQYKTGFCYPVRAAWYEADLYWLQVSSRQRSVGIIKDDRLWDCTFGLEEINGVSLIAARVLDWSHLFVFVKIYLYRHLRSLYSLFSPFTKYVRHGQSNQSHLPPQPSHP